MLWFFLFQVAISCIMSGYNISTEFSQYVIAAAFLPPTINPLLFCTFPSDFRDGYKALLQLIPDKVTKIFKGLFSVYQQHFRLLYHTRLASTTSVFIWPDFLTKGQRRANQWPLGRAMPRPTGPLLFFSVYLERKRLF